MTDEEIQRVAKETGTPEAVIRTALPLIPVDKHSEWIGLLKSDNAASKMAHSYGWTVDHAISDIRGTSPPRKRSPMRFRFTIRDLLWLTALVALAVGWWLDHSDLKWTTAKDRDFEAECKAKAKQAEDAKENWKSVASHQDATIRRLQKYLYEKHPDERIDWDTVDKIPDELSDSQDKVP